MTVWTGDEAKAERVRRVSAKARILAALRAAGTRGCTNTDLTAICLRYGGRIHELRKTPYRCDIESIDEGEGCWRFVLHEPARGSQTRVLEAVERWPVTEPEARPGMLF